MVRARHVPRAPHFQIGDFGTSRIEQSVNIKTGLVTHTASNSRQMSQLWAAPEVMVSSVRSACFGKPTWAPLQLRSASTLPNLFLVEIVNFRRYSVTPGSARCSEVAEEYWRWKHAFGCLVP